MPEYDVNPTGGSQGPTPRPKTRLANAAVTQPKATRPTSFWDAIDGGGYGGSGDSFSNQSHQDYMRAGGQENGETSFWDRLTSDRLDDPNSRSMTDTRSDEEKIQALQAWSEDNQRRDSQRAARIDGDGDGGKEVATPAEKYTANKKRYDDYKAKQKADADRASGMDRARRMYEQQNMGAGSVPPQMQGLGQFRNPFMPRMPMLPPPQPMPQNQATSPAFRYAAQNYGRLGGQQRMYDRPQEMMSQRERQGVNDIYDRFNQRPVQMPIEPYVPDIQPDGAFEGVDKNDPRNVNVYAPNNLPQQPPVDQNQLLMHLLTQGGKGAGQTQPQVQSDFGEMLARRFSGGNQGGGLGF